MGLNLARKIIRSHLVEGEMRAGEEIGLRIDQTLTYDTLGPMALLQFEAMGIPRVRTKRSVVYVDHSMLQLGFESHDDHRFVQTMAARYGMYFSRPGNGICHQVHLERFTEPGSTLLGTDSHTPTAGAVGMLGIGAGGLDVAVVMGGGFFHVRMPRAVRVHLTGRLRPWVASKDVILELLRRLSVKGGVGRVFEYAGEGVADLAVPERATICNMGTELGATSSLFPSDESVRAFLRAQGREAAWTWLGADPDAEYDETIEIDLARLEPLIACPGSPDAVVPVRELEGLRADQVCIGSCTNSSLADLSAAAAVLRGRTVHPSVSMTVTPGSRQVLQMITRSGALADLVDAGARILEATCGPCIGMGQAPGTDAVSVRTFNRNFTGRSGNKADRVYLASPQVAAATALRGEITDPRRLGEAPVFRMPAQHLTDDRMIVPPPADPSTVEVFRGPNLKPVPLGSEAPETLSGAVLLKTGDNVSTDDIIPGGPKALPLRSNLPALSRYAFEQLDPTFAERATASGGGIILGGFNYGQGSSREHAALVPMFLKVKAVLAESFARIHEANLPNVGILALTFADEADYDRIEQGDELEIAGLREAVARGRDVRVRNVTRGTTFVARHNMTPRQVAIYLDGGVLSHLRSQARK